MGPTAKVLWDEIQSLEPKLYRGTFEKKMFGMLTDQVLRVLEQMAEENNVIKNVILGGIEVRYFVESANLLMPEETGKLC